MRTSTTGCLGIIGISLLLAACSQEQPPAETGTSSPTSRAPSSASDRPAGVDPSTQRDVVAERLPYAEVDEKLVYGHFAFPAEMIDPLPAVIIIHDRWGLNEEMQKIADRLAGEGYIVLGVDLFDGSTAETPAGARRLELDVLEEPDLAVENLSGALDFITNTAGAPRIAVVGFGFGGGWSLNAALDLGGELSASAMFYGQVTDDAERLAMLDVPLLGLFAQGDRAVPAESVEIFRTALEAQEKNVDIHIYPDARRGFADRLSDNYDPDIAEDAWGRLLEFLQPRMSGNEE